MIIKAFGCVDFYKKELDGYKVNLDNYIELMYNINGKIWRASP